MTEDQLVIRVAPTPRATEAVVDAEIGNLSDQQLMRRVVDGDPLALESLYGRYASAVMGLAFKMLGERSLAEEVVQETFWRVWRNGATFRQTQGAFSSWLLGITRNLCIDIWRRRNSRPQPVSEEETRSGSNPLPDPQVDVAESAWTAIKHRQVRTAMDSLPPAQRRVLELAYFWGMTRQEIADDMGIPLGTVHTRARLGLQKLREALQQEGFED